MKMNYFIHLKTKNIFFYTFVYDILTNAEIFWNIDITTLMKYLKEMLL